MATDLSLINSTPPRDYGRPHIFPGVPLEVEGDWAGVHGLAAPYRLADLGQGPVYAPRAQYKGQIVIWDSNFDCAQLPKHIQLRQGDINVHAGNFALADNSLRILNCRLVGPALINAEGAIQLHMQPIFELDYQAEYFPAQVAELRVVTSQRFLNLHNGKTTLLTHTNETQGPAVVLGEMNTLFDDTEYLTQIFTPVLWQEHKQLRADMPIYQTIINECDGVPVTSLTVLEQYTSYFLQRYYAPTKIGCWVPAAPPITWGLSIRVGKNGEDEWAIVRRKLIMPTPGHEGLQLPHWSGSLRTTPHGYAT
ncbi:MAG TPA: hypothetical protein PKD17_13130 [Cellvibrionaceae bacterium]|nr:hypothetical protein [Cellvibrionaceae bacterium]HMW72765.1 hypothetical protein [Cellvibrionaceae bacterium]HMY38058.1 hypothetical protein [Marinagarivorans sp.]HNG60407.1 hypothetical protein [Cellvibrionaceae bacterium]